MKSKIHKMTNTSREGVKVDVKIHPLIEALWAKGIDTEYSCEGWWKHQRPHESEDVNAAYILFSDIQDALKFIECTFYIFEESSMRLTPAYSENHMNYRGIVRFNREHLSAITEHWTSPQNPLESPIVTLDNASLYARVKD